MDNKPRPPLRGSVALDVSKPRIVVHPLERVRKGSLAVTTVDDSVKVVDQAGLGASSPHLELEDGEFMSELFHRPRTMWVDDTEVS